MADQSHAAAEDVLGPPDVDAAQPRVGRTPMERLEWAVRFAQADLNGLSRGDWLNLRLELTAFGGILIREHDRHSQFRLQERRTSAAREDPIVYAERDVGELHGEFARIVGRLLQNDSVTVGSYQVTLTVERWPVAATNVGRPVRLRTSFPPGTSRATHVLAHLLGMYGHLLKQCPAPLARGARDDRCGRWFLARRPNQVYCGARCQSRATTRASREVAGQPRRRARKRQAGGRRRKLKR